jgi:type I restriction enzyme S subunit
MTLVPLEQLLDLSDSGVWGDEDSESGVSVLRSTNFNRDGTIDFSNLTFRAIEERKRSAKILQDGDILLEKSGGGPKQPVGRVCLYRGHALQHSFGNFIARLRPRSEILSEFLFYFLWYFHATGKTCHYQKQTTGIRNLEYKRFLSIGVPVPPLPEQRSIVDLLSRAEGIVRLRREAEKKAAELIPALFLGMFGDPATNPKGWPVATVGDVLDAAEYGSSSKASSDGAGLPMIRMGNVTYAGSLDLADLKYVDLPAAEVERYSLREGDVLFNRTNSKELVGKTGLWDGTRGAIVASYFIRLRVRRQVLSPHYLWAFMNTAHMKRVIFDTARGAIGQSNINSKELKAFPLPVPPLVLQQQFALRCADVSGLATQQSTATAKAQAAFDALLAQVFATE